MDTPPNSPAPDDWRRQRQERYLQGEQWIRRAYRAYTRRWDHDRCKFCSATFSMSPGDLHLGYCTVGEYHWVCDTCFEDFRHEFKWTIVEEHPSTGVDPRPFMD